MIKIYHGTIHSKHIPGKVSRYGFPAMFYTPSLELAHNYAKHHAQGSDQEPVVRQLSITPYQIDKTVDFSGNVTFSPEFRNLVHENRHHNIVRVVNCLDRPSEDYPLIHADIYIFYG